MPFSITTKDGITIDNIPDDVDPNSDVLRQRVADIRAQRGGGDAVSTGGVVGPADGQVQLGDQAAGLGVDPSPAVADGLDQPVRGGSTFEPLGTIGTGILAEPIAGLAGIVQAINPFAEEGAGARTVKAVREALTFQPITDVGRQQLQVVGETVAPIGEALSNFEQSIGQSTFEATGSPVAAATVQSLPTLALELVGLASVKATASGVKSASKIGDAIKEAKKSSRVPFVDPQGLPSPAFEKALKKRGLTFGNVMEEVASLPEEIKLLPPPKAVEGIIVNKLKAGDADDVLATIRLGKGDRIQVDDIGQQAVRQGFQAGDVASAKAATASTRESMRKMLRMTRRIKANSSLAQKFRPTDVVGESVLKRFAHIRQSANNARRELDSIAKKTLGGKQINAASVEDALFDQLDQLDIAFDSTGGRPVLNFEGSQIAKDRTSQKVINDVVSLLGDGTAPDALRAHKIKRQLDTLIDFRKKSAGGLTEAGRNVAKTVRRSLNDAVRDVSPDYARVNDVLSQSLDAMNGFQDVLGPSIDVFADGASKAIGQDLRGLLSNRKSRVRLDNAVNSLDDTARDLGAVFDDDVRDLVQFANTLDDQFGAVARTSLKGEVESAVKGAARGRAGIVEAGVEAAGKAAEKARGINEERAFRVMEELLMRGK